MDVREALDAAVYALYRARLGMVVGDTDFNNPENEGRDDLIARAAIVAFLERMPEFGEATVSANYAERPVNTPSRILAAIREAQHEHDNPAEVR